MSIREFSIVAAVAISATSATAQSPLPAQLARVDSLLTAQYPPSEPGAVVAIVRDGAVVFVAAHGMADLEAKVRTQPETPFNVMSVAKQFTAASIALLVSRGDLSLDDDVRKHIPELPDYGDTIRVRHLLHHSSGLRDVHTLWTLAGGSPEDVRGRTDHLAMITRQRQLNFAPGTTYAYSNSGYILLALIVERVSHKTFPEFTTQNLFAPLNMSRSAFSAPEPTPRSVVLPSYRRDSTGHWVRLVSRDRRTGASDLVSTVPDLARWVIGLEQSRIGGPGFAASLETRGILANGDTAEYAFGNLIDRHEGFREILHSGGLLGVRCKISRFPQRNLGIVYCGNGSPAYNDTFYAIANILLLDAPLPKPRTAVATAARRASAQPVVPVADPLAFGGRYVSRELGQDLIVDVSGGEHVVRAARTILARGVLSGADSTLRVTHSDLGALTFRFFLDEDGRQTRMAVSTERVRNLVLVREAQ